MMSRDIRQRALQKIAALSVANAAASFDMSDLDRLCKACPSHGKAREVTNGHSVKQYTMLGRVPMVGILPPL